MYLIYRIIQKISNVVNVNATNIVKNKSQRDKLVNLLHLLCHVTYIFLLNFKIKSLNTPRYHLSLYQTYHQFLAGKQGVEPRSTVLETAVLPLNYFPMLAISKYLIINFLGPYLQDPYRTFHYNFA